MAWKSYTPVSPTWKDNDPTAQVTAARQNAIEQGIVDATTVANKPLVAAEGAVKVGAIGVSRAVNANLTGNAVLTKFKIKHGLTTQLVVVTVYTSSFEITTIAKIVAISTEEVELTFSVAPGGGVTFWVKIEG